MRRLQGFSLVEMMVAISVAAVLFLIALPRLRGASHRANVHNARGNVVALFQKAKLRAIQEARSTTLNVNNATGVLWITATPRRSGGTATCGCDTLGTQNLNQVYGVTVNAAPTSFTFDPRGLGVLRTGNAMTIMLTRSEFKDSVLVSGFGELAK